MTTLAFPDDYEIKSDHLRATLSECESATVRHCAQLQAPLNGVAALLPAAARLRQIVRVAGVGRSGDDMSQMATALNRTRTLFDGVKAHAAELDNCLDFTAEDAREDAGLAPTAT